MLNSVIVTPVIDNGGYIGIIVTAALGLVGIIVANVLSRRASKDHNYVETFTANATAFQANMEAFTLRAKNAEAAVIEVKEQADAKHAELQDQLNRLQDQMSTVLQDRKKERGDYTRMRTVVQKWFLQIQSQWPKDQQMPLPSDIDLDWLGITIEHAPKMVT